MPPQPLPVPGRPGLAASLHAPADPARTLVQVVHGMAEHSGRYAETVRRLTDAGLGVVTSDLPGHGSSAGPRFHLADHHGWGMALGGLRAVTDAAREASGIERVVLLGHPMGSYLARDYARRWGDDLSGLVLSGPGGPLDATEKAARALAVAQVRLRGPRSRAAVLSKGTYATFNRGFGTRTSFEWLSRDTDRVDAYVADPGCGGICTAGFFRDMLGGIASAARPLRLPPTLPVLVLAGADDPVGRRGRVPLTLPRTLTEHGTRSVSVKVYPGARHEVLQETNREEVLADLLAWLEEEL